MTAGPPTEPPILTAEETKAHVALHASPAMFKLADSHEALRADRDALRARLRDAEETLRLTDQLVQDAWNDSPAGKWRYNRLRECQGAICAYFERHADPQEKP